MPYLTLRTASGVLTFRTDGGGEVEPPPPGEAFASLTLANTSPSPTSATTFYPFGHPFAQGEVPAGSRIEATWDDEAVPVQVSGRASWPDGSLRFGRVFCKLPAISGASSGTLSLSVGEGAQDEALPGAATVAGVVLALRTDYPFTVSADNLTRNSTPVADGSGSWTADVGGSLALYGSTDASGRVVCEAIESGPLCVGVRCLTRFADTTGGALHPHLSVVSWLRAWLDESGAIARVEYLHAIHQGWIGDLDGGTVAAGLQVGDFAVKLAGDTVAGQAWTGLHVPHHTRVYLTAVAADGSAPEEHTGGSHWTADAPTLHSAIDPDYWRSTGQTPAYDLEFFAAEPVPSESSLYGASVGFVAGPTTNAGRVVKSEKAINGTGNHDFLGLWPRWDALAFLSGCERGYERSSLSTALASGTMPLHMLNPATGRLPALIDAANFDGPSNGLGTNRSTTYYINHSSKSADVRMETNNTGGDGTGPGNTEGGWIGPWDMSHMPSLAAYQALRTGQPWLAEEVAIQGHASWACHNWRQSRTMPSGVTGRGYFICLATNSPRDEAWSFKVLAQALAILPDADPARAYLDWLYDRNESRLVAELAAAPANMQTLGVYQWAPWYRPSWAPGYKEFSTSPWMEHFFAIALSWAHLALGRGSDSGAVLDFLARGLKGRGGGDPLQTCAWPAASYHATYGCGPTTSDFFADWSEVPHYKGLSTCTFDATARSTGWIGSSSTTQPVTRDNVNLHPLIPGDRIMFIPQNANFAGTALPPGPIVVGQWYEVAEVDDATGIKRLRIRPDGGGATYESFDAGTSSVCGWAVQLSYCPSLTTAEAGRNFVQGEVAYGYAAIFQQAVRQFCLAGVFDPEAAWIAEVDDRIEAMRSFAFADFPNHPHWRVAKSLT